MKKTGKISIMVADDAPFIREIVKKIFSNDDSFEWMGEAHDGLEIVELAQKLKPDVVLMDMVMPKQNGVLATTQILEKLPNTKIIAFSTLDQEQIILQALEAGCCSYVHKPFEAQKLKDVVHESYKIGGSRV